MDSRIEELAQIIRERAGASADNLSKTKIEGQYHYWRRLESLAVSMLRVIEEYRREHPEEYTDDRLLKVAERERCIEIVMTELDGNGQAHAIAAALRNVAA